MRDDLAPLVLGSTIPLVRFRLDEDHLETVPLRPTQPISAVDLAVALLEYHRIRGVPVDASLQVDSPDGPILDVCMLPGSRELPQPSHDAVSGREAAARAGVTYRQVDYWVTMFPRFAAELRTDMSPGSGTFRTIRKDRMPRVHIVADLVRCGMDLRTIMAIEHQERLAKRAVIVGDSRYFRARIRARKFKVRGSTTN
jgi:hypothetical protein